MVAAGAAEAETGERIYHEDSFFGGVSVSSCRFGSQEGRQVVTTEGTPPDWRDDLKKVEDGGDRSPMTIAVTGYRTLN